MTRTRVRRRRIALIAVVATGGGLWAGPISHAQAGRPLRPAAEHRYVVRQGDTLWDIASRLSGGEDPRPLMDAIQAANAVDPAALAPGQTLVVPSS